jgi:hypothetical protein
VCVGDLGVGRAFFFGRGLDVCATASASESSSEDPEDDEYDAFSASEDRWWRPNLRVIGGGGDSDERSDAGMLGYEGGVLAS